jgi:hypothetical protein
MADKSEWPAWDYWMWESLSDGRTLSIYYEQKLEDGDIRSENYEADLNRWCHEHFWDPVEATCLSFLRDPIKFKASDSWLEDDHCDYKEHAQLLGCMSKLHDMIVDAQEKKQLPPDFFTPAMYVAWARRVGVSVPQSIPRQLEKVEHERQQNRVAPTASTVGTERDSDDELPEDKVSSQDSKFRNNARKVILALLLKSGLIGSDTTKLAGQLELELNDQRDRKKDDSLFLNGQTIKKRLNEARGLLK